MRNRGTTPPIHGGLVMTTTTKSVSDIRCLGNGLLVSCLTTSTLLSTSAFARAASPLPREAEVGIDSPVAGIHHWEIVVIGPSVTLGAGFASCDTWNRAYEITDCGLVVGQLAVQPTPPAPGMPPCLTVERHAFIYSSVPRPELGLGVELRLLPNTVGSGAVAFDANDYGYIVGSAGTPSPDVELDEETLERAMMWRVTPSNDGGAHIVGTVVLPPDVSADGAVYGPFDSYNQEGFGRLSAIQSGAEPHAAGTFGLVQGCTSGGFPLTRRRTSVAAVHFSSSGISYLVSDFASRGDPHALSLRERALGIADTRLSLGGLMDPSCSLTPTPCPLTPSFQSTMWEPIETPNLLRGDDRTPDIFQLGAPEIKSRSPIHAIKDGGEAAGLVSDDVPLQQGGSVGCETHAAAWAPGTGSVVAMLGGLTTELQSRHGFASSEAADLDRIEFQLPGAGPLSGTLVVGSGTRDQSRRFGALWFRPEANLPWNQAWTYREVSSMVSPISPLSPLPEEGSFRVARIDGVNIHGDMAGQMIVEIRRENLPPETHFYPILLRAVRISGVGDLNRDGNIDEIDRAIMRQQILLQRSGLHPDPIADLNLDGSVDTYDRALLEPLGRTTELPGCNILFPDTTGVLQAEPSN